MSAQAIPPAQPTRERLRVLLVDDNEGILTRAARVLNSTCSVVGVVTDGRAGLEAAAVLNPDVIVLDITMPGMSGLDVADRLRAAGSTAVVVFMTVHDETEFVAAAQAAGALGYVVKRRLVSDLPLAVREARAGRSFVSPVS
jgi:DNA-binding NarL/FixJ family response regulator